LNGFPTGIHSCELSDSGHAKPRPARAAVGFALFCRRRPASGSPGCLQPEIEQYNVLLDNIYLNFGYEGGALL
ncbi:hypothetical protein, partial [uncultured Muribaculum sp.]|uniref:hypothetical protein n=1 Tax=uncultured Muribaculum sp. TaxID=1918613 RepID=UPI00272B25F0